MNLSEYKQKEMTMEATKAQLLALVYFIPSAIIFGLPFYFLWPGKFSKASYMAELPQGLSSSASLFLFFIVVIAGIIVHELIHGLTWSLYARSGFRSIRFGVLWKSVTPYCHCKEPLKVGSYIVGALMPGIVLGFLPMIIALFTGSVLLLAFGMFFTLAAGGDFMIIGMLSKIDKKLLVQDHPSKIGCILYEPATHASERISIAEGRQG